jgi:hypothetical protein
MATEDILDPKIFRECMEVDKEKKGSGRFPHP